METAEATCVHGAEQGRWGHSCPLLLLWLGLRLGHACILGALTAPEQASCLAVIAPFLCDVV